MNRPLGCLLETALQTGDRTPMRLTSWCQVPHNVPQIFPKSDLQACPTSCRLYDDASLDNPTLQKADLRWVLSTSRLSHYEDGTEDSIKARRDLQDRQCMPLSASMNHATNPYIFPSPTSEEVHFILPSFMKLGQLCRHGLERALYLLLLHVFFSGLVRFFPSFDGSGDFALGSHRATWNVGVAASCITIPTGFLYYLVPLYIQRKECSAAGNFGPANELRKRWAPASLSPAMRRWAVHAAVVLTFVAGSYMVKPTMPERRVIDPFHAGVLGVVARVMFCAVRWYVLGDSKLEEEVLLPSDYYTRLSVNV
ncbi:hypothetical protein C8Q74DRAFT_713493 [Fomes fomentarius]|nr:hypothetical protein C8Q74DRAFT_713493 [Fomes fomentarius]